jgi:hypothetical protein
MIKIFSFFFINLQYIYAEGVHVHSMNMFLGVPLKIVHKVAQKQYTFVNDKLGLKEQIIGDFK